MGRTEVTFAEWDHCVAAKMCRAIDDLGQGRGNRPVSLVSFDDAQAYIKWLNFAVGLADRHGNLKDPIYRYELPDFAAWFTTMRGRGGGSTAYGDNRAALSPDIANYDWSASFNESPRATPVRQALPVGSFPPNSLGFFDLIGNLREWTRSCDGDITPKWPDVTEEQRERLLSDNRQCRFRLVVGGSFADHPRDLRHNARNAAGELEVTGRLEDPGERNLRTGFRVSRFIGIDVN